MDGRTGEWMGSKLRQTHQLITRWKSLCQTHKYPHSTFSTNHRDMLDYAKCCNARHLLEPERDEPCIGYHLGLVRMWEVRVRTHLAHHSRDAKRWWPQHEIVAWACLKSFCLSLLATCNRFSSCHVKCSHAHFIPILIFQKTCWAGQIMKMLNFHEILYLAVPTAGIWRWTSRVLRLGILTASLECWRQKCVQIARR